MSNFAKLFVHPRYGQILAIKVAYQPKIELHTEISGVRCIVGIDMAQVVTKQPYREMNNVWDKLNCDNAASLIDEYRENSPELQEEIKKSHFHQPSDADNFVWKPKDESD